MRTMSMAQKKCIQKMICNINFSIAKAIYYPLIFNISYLCSIVMHNDPYFKPSLENMMHVAISQWGVRPERENSINGPVRK